MLLIPAAPASAQAVTGEILSLGIGGMHGAGRYRLGHWVPVHVHLENRSGGAFDGFLSVEQNDLDGDKVLSLKPIHLDTDRLDGQDFWLYYWPKPDETGTGTPEVAVLDAQQHVLTTFAVHRLMEPAGIAPEHGEDGHSQRWVVLLGGKSQMGLGNYVKSKGGTATTRLTWISSASNLPDNVLGLDGVDVLVWDAESVRVSDMPADFQLKALLDWVRSGGHLVITASTQGNELCESRSKISEAMPLQILSTKQLPDASIFQRFISQRMATIPGPFIQMTGRIKPGARAVLSGSTLATPAERGNGGDQPLVVIGTYGTGTVTVITVDPAAFPGTVTAVTVDATGLRTMPVNAMSPENWLAFWQKTMGWSGEIWTDSRLNDQLATEERDRSHTRPHILTNPAHAKLDAAVPNAIDFNKVTYVRLLLAVLFLGAYWIVAGPGGHLVLRHYKLTHWSWWIFGACVVAASAAAMLVVATFKLEHYDYKHVTYVMGRADSGEATVQAFYGIFAPKDNMVSLELPDPAGSHLAETGGGGSSGGGGGGLTYLCPFNEPRFEGIEPFADPQQYQLLDTKTAGINVPFRSTLKKMQARWTGELPDKITSDHVGTTLVSLGGAGSLRKLALTGTLKNETRYDLQDVTIIALAPNARPETSGARVFDAGSWKHGDTINLAKIESRAHSDDLDRILTEVGKSVASGGEELGHIGMGMGHPSADPLIAADEKHKAELLNTLLELRTFEGLFDSNPRVEFIRSLTRTVDRSAALRASRILVLAYAGTPEAGAPSPLKLKIDNRDLPGTGEIIFTWTIDAPEPQPPAKK